MQSARLAAGSSGACFSSSLASPGHLSAWIASRHRGVIAGTIEAGSLATLVTSPDCWAVTYALSANCAATQETGAAAFAPSASSDAHAGDTNQATASKNPAPW